VNRHFIRHYIEMVVAMLLGMVVLGLPAEAGLRAMGTSTSALEADAPEVVLLGMAAIMTVPMVAWMRYRGHGWQVTAEMAASMVLPTLGAIAVYAAGLVADFDAVLLGEHVVMLAAMAAAMLLRPSEYLHHHHGHGHGHAAVPAVA
jgi:hypothetical protein